MAYVNNIRKGKTTKSTFVFNKSKRLQKLKEKRVSKCIESNWTYKSCLGKRHSMELICVPSKNNDHFKESVSLSPSEKL